MFLLDPHLLWHTVTIRRNTVQCFHEWIKIIDADQFHLGGMSQSLNSWRKIINLVRETSSLACLCLQNLQQSRESVTAHCLQQSSPISFILYWIWLKWAELNKAELIGSVAKSFPVFMNLCQKGQKEMKWVHLFQFRNEYRITSQQLN